MEKQIYGAIKSGKIVRMKGTPAEKMTDSELARWIMNTVPPPELEYALKAAGPKGYVQVSGKPPYSQADAKEIIEQMTAMAKNPKRGKNG